MKKDVAENLDLWFKTQIQIAVDLLRLSLLVQVNPEAVVFDAWHMPKELRDFLRSRGLTWVSEAKCNRLIEINESWLQLKNFARNLSKSEFHQIDKQLGEKRYNGLVKQRF